MVFLDDYEPCVEGAREAGIHAVLYAGNAQALRDIENLLSSGRRRLDLRVDGEVTRLRRRLAGRYVSHG